ncbi:MAG: hypothetical protein AAFR38_12535 [Planctomycetota bacterium]
MTGAPRPRSSAASILSTRAALMRSWPYRPMRAWYVFIAVPGVGWIVTRAFWGNIVAGQLVLVIMSLLMAASFVYLAVQGWRVMVRCRGWERPHERCDVCGYRLEGLGEDEPCPECNAPGGPKRARRWAVIGGHGRIRSSDPA